MVKRFYREERVMAFKRLFFNLRVMFGTASLLTGISLLLIGVSIGPDPKQLFRPMELYSGFILLVLSIFIQPHLRSRFERLLEDDPKVGKSGW